jgi:ketosteroid isomerase-like protein
MSPDPIAIVERYLAIVADLDVPAAALADVVHPDARFVEHPNAIAPTGRRRDAEAARAALERSRSLLSAQRFDVVDHVAAGERVVTRARWTATLAIDAGPVAAGTELHADCCMLFTVRNGRIHRQENYDCYHPLSVA